MTKGREPAQAGTTVGHAKLDSEASHETPPNPPRFPHHASGPDGGDAARVGPCVGFVWDADDEPDGECVTVTYDSSLTHPNPSMFPTGLAFYGGVGDQVAPPSEPEPSPSRLRTHMPTIASRRALAREAAQKRLRIALDELRASVQGLGRALRETARTALLARAVPPSARKRITVAAAPDVRRMASEGRLLCRDDHPTRVGRSTWSPQSQRLRWTVPAGTNVVGGQVRSMPTAAERTDSTGDLATRRVEAVGDGVGRTLSEDSYHLHPEDCDD